MTERQWRKSSHSGNQGDCLEVCFTADGTEVRDSKDPHGGILPFTANGWAAFLSAIEKHAPELR